MRLVCPNCNAQYEVPDDAFGNGGRDVQCSNCEHTWFASSSPPAPATPPAPQAKAQQTSQGKPYPNADAARTTPQTQPIDPEVQKVLRDEAEQELAARRRRQRRGLKPKPTAAQAAAAQLEPARAPAPAPPPQAADVAPSHHLLPDVEEINSSLIAPVPSHKSLPTAGPMPAPPRRKHRRAFRVGFLVAILILALLSGPYIFATEIIATFPQVSAPMNQYILVVNEYRQMLFEYSQDILVILQNATGSSAGE